MEEARVVSPASLNITIERLGFYLALFNREWNPLLDLVPDTVC